MLHLRKLDRCRLRTLLIALPILLPQVCLAHSFHISTAEMEYNPETHKIEVSLKLHSLDLEQALSKTTGRRVDLAQESNDEALENYLTSHFYLLSHEQATRIAKGESISPEKARSTVSLAGKELKSSWLWLYFEMDRPVVEGNYAIVNTILLDITDGQINTVSIRHHAKRDAVQTNIKQPWREIPRQWLGAAPPRTKNF
jgi:hypothetical protein